MKAWNSNSWTDREFPRRVKWLSFFIKNTNGQGMILGTQTQIRNNILFFVVQPNVYSEPYSIRVEKIYIISLPGDFCPYSTLISVTFLGLKCLGTGPIWFLVFDLHRLLQKFLHLYWCPFRYSSSYFLPILKAQETFCQANTELST